MHCSLTFRANKINVHSPCSRMTGLAHFSVCLGHYVPSGVTSRAVEINFMLTQIRDVTLNPALAQISSSTVLKIIYKNHQLELNVLYTGRPYIDGNAI